jgi:Luciferase-like monooxygenase
MKVATVGMAVFCYSLSVLLLAERSSFWQDYSRPSLFCQEGKLLMSDARPFRFGLAVTGGVSSREEWIGLARRVEDLGYATLLVADHYVNEYPPIAALMAAADAASTLRVGSYVFNNGFRHPVRLAKEVAALDRLSGGRFELGLGAGWYQPEYNQVGLPFESASVRIRRLAEGVSIIKQFFVHDLLDLDRSHPEPHCSNPSRGVLQGSYVFMVLLDAPDDPTTIPSGNGEIPHLAYLQ